MNIADCKNLGSPTYRRLCQTLSLPPPQEGVNKVGLTGFRGPDLTILSHFSDEELINVCATNKYINVLCQDDSFWMNRTVNKFGNILGTGEEIRQYIPAGTTWKDYYLWLSGMQNAEKTLVHELALLYDRDDLLLLIDDHIQQINAPAPVAPGAAIGIPPVLAGILVAGGLMPAPPIGPVVGFTAPKYLSDNMRNFFREANLGPSDPSNKWSEPLATSIDVGIANVAVLTPLFNIYAHVNNMTVPGELQFLSATPLMHKYFAADFAAIPNFDPNRFRYASLQRLINRNIVPADQLTPFQQVALQDPSLHEYLASLQRYLSRVLAIYREAKKEAVKARNAARRQ